MAWKQPCNNSFIGFPGLKPGAIIANPSIPQSLITPLPQYLITSIPYPP